jgi:hypothetical protein
MVIDTTIDGVGVRVQSNQDSPAIVAGQVFEPTRSVDIPSVTGDASLANWALSTIALYDSLRLVDSALVRFLRRQFSFGHKLVLSVGGCGDGFRVMAGQVQENAVGFGRAVMNLSDRMVTVVAEKLSDLPRFLVFVVSGAMIMIDVEVTILHPKTFRRVTASGALAALFCKHLFVSLFRDAVHSTKVLVAMLQFVLRSFADNLRLGGMASVALLAPVLVAKLRDRQNVLTSGAQCVVRWYRRHFGAYSYMWLKVLPQVETIPTKTAIGGQRMFGAARSMIAHFDERKTAATVRAVAIDTAVGHYPIISFCRLACSYRALASASRTALRIVSARLLPHLAESAARISRSLFESRTMIESVLG